MSSSTPGQTTHREYEFSQQDDQTIGALAYSMRGVGFFFMLLGMIYLVIGVVSAVHQFQAPVSTSINWSAILVILCNAVIWIYIGTGTRAAATHFQRIVSTSDHDVQHLMRALVRLRGVYGLIYALILLLVVMSLMLLTFQVWGISSPANPALN